MRIFYGSKNLDLPITDTSKGVLMKLLAEQKAIQGLLKRVTPHSLVVQIQRKEFELPLNGVSMEQWAPPAAGDLVELRFQTDQSFTLHVLSTPEKEVAEQQPLSLSPFEEVLLELNIPPTPEAVQVAQGLLERGFPLKEDLLWLLLPWAERGQLEEAFILLQGKFPLKPQLVDLVEQLKTRDLQKPLLQGVIDELSPDLKESFQFPSFANRVKWNGRLADGELFKALVRLLVEERLLEAVHKEHVFALPFFQGEDLYSSWIRIIKDEYPKGKVKTREQGGNWRIELQIPTQTLGVVEAVLQIQEKKVRVTLYLEEGLDGLEISSEMLKQELDEVGWNLQTFEVEIRSMEEGWEYAKSGSFALRPQ